MATLNETFDDPLLMTETLSQRQFLMHFVRIDIMYLATYVNFVFIIILDTYRYGRVYNCEYL